TIHGDLGGHRSLGATDRLSSGYRQRPREGLREGIRRVVASPRALLREVGLSLERGAKPPNATCVHHRRECSVRTRIFAALGAAFCLAWIVGCSSDRSAASRLNGAETGHVTVRLTDAPGDYDAVNVVISGVSLRRAGDEDG